MKTLLSVLLILTSSAFSQGQWPIPAPPGPSDAGLLACSGADDLTQVAWDWDCLNAGCLADADATWETHWWVQNAAFHDEQDRLRDLVDAALIKWDKAIDYRDNQAPPALASWAQERVDEARKAYEEAHAAYLEHINNGWPAYLATATGNYDAEFCACECWTWWPA